MGQQIILTSATAELFLRRFQNFGDGIIKQVIHSYGACGRHTDVLVTVPDQDSANGWSGLKLSLDSVTEFKLVEQKSSCECVSVFGVRLHWLDETIFISFDSETDAEIDSDTIRQSCFYVRGKQLSWQLCD